MPFSNDETIQIWTLFSLKPEELEQNSNLRDALQYLEQFDAREGTTLVSTVQDLLERITTEETAKESAFDRSAYQRYAIAGGEDVMLRQGSDPVVIASGKVAALKTQVKRILKLDEFLYNGNRTVARVRGTRYGRLGYSYGRGYHHG